MVELVSLVLVLKKLDGRPCWHFPSKLKAPKELLMKRVDGSSSYLMGTSEHMQATLLFSLPTVCGTTVPDIPSRDVDIDIDYQGQIRRYRFHNSRRGGTAVTFPHIHEMQGEGSEFGGSRRSHVQSRLNKTTVLHEKPQLQIETIYMSTDP